jgi:predicted dithiol-disulfide oxidoreductase (DUF899 family)
MVLLTRPEFKLTCGPALGHPSLDTSFELKQDRAANGLTVEDGSMSIRFPNETAMYRSARNDLLQRERELRRQMEAVAAELRRLPGGGEVPEDYVFERMGPDGCPETVKLSELFADGNTLMVYHYMFPRHSRDERPGPASGSAADLPLEEGPCPSCTALIDMWEGTMPHFKGLGGNLVIVARAPIGRVTAFARDKGWKNTDLLSAAGNNFRRDYGGDGADGEPVPIMTVFKRDADGSIRLHWASELVFEPADPGQDMRHLGTVEPLWTLFDLTPEGRPVGLEQFAYACCGSSAP